MILEYLKWRGDLTFKQDKFNVIDALILSRISYIYFDGIMDDNIVNLREALKEYLRSEDIDKRTIWPTDIELAKELLNSKRFKNIKISDYVNKRDEEVEKQFSAILIHIDSKTKVVSFRGTDNSVIGWKEDFNMSFTKHIPAQIEAVKYLRKVMNKYSKGEFIQLGHSKGGNLAIYSSIMIEDEYNERIKEIYNFDGPGFNEEIYNNKKYDIILNKIKTYIPRESVVGIILGRKENEIIVSSNERLLMQHDVYTWEINKNDFKYEKNISKSSKILGRSMAKWLESVPETERKEFIDTLFSIIMEVDSNFKDIFRNFNSSFQIIFKTIKDPTIRDFVFKAIKVIYEEYKKEK